MIFVFFVQKSVNALAETVWDVTVSHIFCFYLGNYSVTWGHEEGTLGRTGCLKLTALVVVTEISQVRRNVHSSYFLK